MSNKEIIKETNKLMKGLREADYQLIKQKSMLEQNIITEDTSGNIIEIPAKDLYEKTFLCLTDNGKNITPVDMVTKYLLPL